jgi:hypothetical protein
VVEVTGNTDKKSRALSRGRTCPLDILPPRTAAGSGAADTASASPSRYRPISQVTCARLSPVIFSTWRRTSPGHCASTQGSVAAATSGSHSRTPPRDSGPYNKSHLTAGLQKRLICSRLKRSPACTLTINSSMQNLSFRLILYEKQTPGPGSSCMRQGLLYTRSIFQ